jgi:tetratricopeptide (TPR) repeat protein
MSHKALGYWFVAHDRMEAALPHFIRSIRLGGPVDNYRQVVTILVALEKFADAIPYLEHVVSQQSINYKARYNLSGSYYMSGRESEARRDLKRILREQPDYEPARKFLSDISN